jgi:hypothetical protein
MTKTPLKSAVVAVATISNGSDERARAPLFMNEPAAMMGIFTRIFLFNRIFLFKQKIKRESVPRITQEQDIDRDGIRRNLLPSCHPPYTFSQFPWPESHYWHSARRREWPKRLPPTHLHENLLAF